MAGHTLQMIRKPIKGAMLNRKAYTLTEIMVVFVLTVIFITSVMGIFVMVKSMYVNSIANQELQRDVNKVVGRIVKGLGENVTRYGLRAGASYTIPAVTEINFIGIDNITRKYYLAPGGIVYESPTETPNTQVLYAPPANSVLTLRFWKPAGFLDNETVGIYMSVTKQTSGRTASGSLTTYVNLRNLSK